MKKICALLFSLVLPLAAHCAEEDQLISVLQSSQSADDKDEACLRLKWIGTAKSVPALAELLTDDKLSQTARNALESMKGPEAEDALLQALNKTTGSNQVGIINSLGQRRDRKAVPDVIKLLPSADAQVAVAATEALGKLGGADALQALQTAWDGSSAGALHDAEDDALLASANSLLTSGDHGAAAKIYRELYDHEKDDAIRLAAFRGLIHSSEKDGIVMMVEAIKGPDGPNQGAALSLASTVGGPATTKALAALLKKAPVPVQIALLQALQERGDRVAATPVAEMLDSTDPAVRMAAIAASADLGDGKLAVRLAQLAAVSSGDEKAAARQALVDLRHGNVTEAMVKPLAIVPADVQAELIRALGDRGDSAAAPKMLELAKNGNDATRSLALQALASLAESPQLAGMIEMVVNSANDDARSEAADALGSAYQHVAAQKGRLEATRLAQAVRTAPVEARVALLGVCSGVSDPQIRAVLREAVSDHNESVSVAALRALCKSQDEQLLPDILLVAQGNTKNPNFRVLGMRGCVRLIKDSPAETLPAAKRIDTLKALQEANRDTEGKRLVLSGLAAVPDPQTLAMAVSMLGDSEVKVEAADATLQIAKAIAAKHLDEATAAIQQVLAQPADAAVRKSAQAALKTIKTAE